MDEGVSGFHIKAEAARAAAVGGGNGSMGTKCGRWNPTSEQVKVLNELFSSGLRTPSTDQIQKISTQLSFYEDKFSSSKRFIEVNNEISDKPERVIETLQLFPLNSNGETEQERLRSHLHANEYRETAATFPYSIGSEMNHPPLDLCLSFM
ncbi:hypothetical protein SLEP1_g37399 [Rubroshorea leprosula]|uniref:Homeobox domain-containing protein n=1 Tax=Rubroshorea leprosula TaxID=152421 RepID=A0AAV5KVB3_9ROSI|nr:hypothetical protein SLEP1_g37399 [Rubroshorea leprosula]